MKPIVSLCLSVLAFFLSGCNLITKCDPATVKGSGVEKTEQRDVGTFTAVDVSGACKVNITCGKTQSVEVSGDDNIVPLIKTEVRGGVLHVWNDEGYSPETDLVITIAAADVRAVNSSGASDVTIRDISNSEFSIDLSGAGSVQALGETGTLTIDLSGAADVDTQELRAKKVLIDVSGASNAEVFASEELSAEVSGVGNITYHGNPQIVKHEVSGVGNISKK